MASYWKLFQFVLKAKSILRKANEQPPNLNSLEKNNCRMP
jgi:hypothetical protein